MTPKMTAPIGIDLGTAYSSIAVLRGDGIDIIPDEHGCLRIPSSHLLTDPSSCVEAEVNVDGDQTIIKILTKLKILAEAYLSDLVKDAVITIPACYGDRQRHAIKEAGKSAGWNVLRLLNASTAAAISHRVDARTDGDHHLLALDLGASRADATLLEIWDCTFEEKSTASDTGLGGRSYDERLYQHFAIPLQYHQHSTILLRETCEQVKRTLSVAQTAQLNSDLLITRDQFEDICDGLFNSTIGLIEQVLRDAKIHKTSVKEVVLAGGLARMPKLHRIVSNFFGIPANHIVFATMGCVRGAALCAASLSSSDVPYFGTFLLVLRSIPYSLFLELRPGFYQLILPRCTAAPHQSTHSFDVNAPIDLPQRLRLFDSQLREKNILGTFDLSSLQCQMSSHQRNELKLSVDIDLDGIMRASLLVTNRSTGNLIILPMERTPIHCKICHRLQDPYLTHQENRKASKEEVQLYLSSVKLLARGYLPREQLVLKGVISEAENWLQVQKQENNEEGGQMLEQLIQAVDWVTNSQTVSDIE